MAKKGNRARPPRPPKLDDVLDRVRTAVESGDFIDLVHAVERQVRRQITRPEYVHVLSTGYHEKAKDEFKVEHQAWNYAIRGRTVDGRSLRVPVAFDTDGTLLVVTVIDLDEKET